VQRGEFQELVDALAQGVEWPTDRLLVWRTAVAVDQFEMVDESRPAREAVAAGDRHLRVRECAHRMELGSQCDGFGIFRSDLLEQALGLVLQVLQARRIRETTGRHGDLLSTCLL
jgi:hypothetical protein